MRGEVLGHAETRHSWKSVSKPPPQTYDYAEDYHQQYLARVKDG
jgi:hypothetical protein